MSNKLSEEKDLSSLEELGRRIEKAKKESSGEDEEKKSSPGAMHVGIDLLAGVLAGSFIGYYLDKWAGTKGVFL